MAFDLGEDPQEYLLRRKRQIDRLQDHYGILDEQELREREEAATAYAGENEHHFVEYCHDCISQSVEASKPIRRVQRDCWNVYNENEPVTYRDKEDWQAHTVVPKPFETVQYGSSAVKKAFSPNFLTIQNSRNKQSEAFWQKTMDYQLNKSHANFILAFTDATTMALAVGVSMEMKPRFVPGFGLQYALIEPWKIHRDPDALSRDPQSGMYWIHQEWLDYFTLKQAEKNGRYFDVARVKETKHQDPSNPFMTKEAIAARKDMLWQRSKFRTMSLTSEFWGIVLDPRGEVLLPKATFTVAGGRVIEKPRPVPYKQLRWPGISFSPVPHLLRHGGRGLLEGIITIWEAMNNIMCLHQDFLQWLVNPPKEINVDALVDSNDSAQWPGKENLVKDTVSGQQAIRTEQRRSRTNDVLANLQYYDQLFQRGSFVTDPVQGLPGYRKEITYREAAQNLDQALSVYSLLGENLEDGAISSISAGAEVIEYSAGYHDYLELFDEDTLTEMGIVPDPENERGVSGIPAFDGTFHVSGIQALMKDMEALANIKDVIIPLSERPRYAAYIKPYNVLKSIEIRTNLTDEDIIASEDEVTVIDTQLELKQAEEQEAIDRMKELQEALGIAELAQKLDEIATMSSKEKAAAIKGMVAKKPTEQTEAA